MPNENEAKEAIEKLNGFSLKGKNLVVTEATSTKKSAENQEE